MKKTNPIIGKNLCWFKPYYYVNYKEVNGLMINEFNMGSYFKSKTGELYFGGINGGIHNAFVVVLLLLLLLW